MTWPGSRRRNSERLKGRDDTTLLFDKAMTVPVQNTTTVLGDHVPLYFANLFQLGLSQIVCQESGGTKPNLLCCAL